MEIVIYADVYTEHNAHTVRLRFQDIKIRVFYFIHTHRDSVSVSASSGNSITDERLPEDVASHPAT